MLAAALAVAAIAALIASGRIVKSGHAGPAVLSASIAPWELPSPLAAASAVSVDGKVYLAGGLEPSGGSTATILRIDPATGRAAAAGTLALAGHDAAAVNLADRAVVFGGGTIASTPAAQAFTPGGDAAVAGRLPNPRSDLAAAELDGRAYLVGGYNGQSTLPDVLSTSDGHSFTTAATLAHPVRYPAVAAAGHDIYAFGGEDVGGTAVATIQRIDPSRHSVQVIGRLPVATSHAAAVTLRGTVYIAGGRSNGGPTDAIWRFDPARGTVTRAGALPIPVSDTAVATTSSDTAYLLGGRGAAPVASVVALRVGAPAPRRPTTAWTPDQPAFPGRLLIADRGNDRLLLVDPSKRILWLYPSRTAPPPPGGFYFPDDAFFIRGGSAIISNQEENHTIVEIGFPSGRILWQYGHPHSAGSAPGYLNQPDDAYLLKDGAVTVADALNCRILFISPAGKPLSQIGTGASHCVHDPPTGVGYPNGDTPLANGNVLVSEIIGRYISEYTRSGQLVWTLKIPEITYPSDPQQLGPDLYLVADYTRPGGIVEFTREGKVVWQYRPTSGDGMLDHPSLAERLPNGLIGVNDDYRNRVALIDPATKRIVWQYGGTDAGGKAGGQVSIPDGFDLLVGSSTPGHPTTG